MSRLSALFKKPVTEKQPGYPFISLEEIPMASAILFYGGNHLTELAGNRLYGHRYAPPAFHAAFYMARGIFLNVGKFKTLQKLKEECRSTRRIDVVIYRDLSEAIRLRLCDEASLDTSRPKVGVSLPDYAWMDYLRFAVRTFKPTKKDFCSENVVELFALEGVRVSLKEPFNTAPWDLQEYAEKNSQCEFRTYWIGSEFMK